MSQWAWAGIDSSGEHVSGTINAGTEREARTLLKNRKIKVRSVRPPSILEFDLADWLAQKGFVSGTNVKDIMVFTKQLGIMVGAGVAILEALEIIKKSTANPVFKIVLTRIVVNVREGKTLSESLQHHDCFDKLYCGLIKAGETGGILETILIKLTEHMEKAEKIKSQIKSALLYPAIISVVGIGVVWGMMTFVVPQFVSMLEDTGQELPQITKIVIAVSDFFAAYTLVMIPMVLVASVLVKNYINTDDGKKNYDKFTMNMPIFGGIVVKGNLASFCRTLSVLLSSGVPLIEALDVCIKTIPNSIVMNDLKRVRKDVENGKNLTETVVRIPYFPQMVSQMIRVGEQTGRIDDMLGRISGVFEEELDLLISTMTKLIEPIVIVVLGTIVGAILLSMYLPMFMAAG